MNPKIGDVNYELQAHSNFYFYFLSLISIRFSNSLTTAGLVLNGINFEINLNPDFWLSIDSKNHKKNQFLLLHELHHLIFKHYRIYKDYDDFDLFNISTDAYINYIVIDEIFKDKSYFIEGGIWYDDDNMKVPIDIVKEGTDAIYNFLKKSNNPKFKDLYNQCASKGKQLIIDHDLWKKLEKSEVSQEVLDKTIEAQVNKILLEANALNRNQGTIPGFLKKFISDLLNANISKIDWKNELKSFIGLFSNKIIIKKSYTKPSKFFDDVTMFKVKFKPKIVVIVDTSGSMNGKNIEEAFSELDNIGKKSKMDILVVECDASITKDSIYPYKNSTELLSRLATKGYSGGGGTVVDPAIAYINKECKDVASIVYLTDGYVSLTKVKPLKPMIVVLTSNGISIESFRSSWGNNFKILKIDSK